MSRDFSEDVSKEKLISDFKAVVADAEDILHATANQTGERITQLREKAMERLAIAKTKLQAAEGVLIDKTKYAARVTDEYVHENPWQSAIIAAGIGFLIGFLSRR